MTRLLNRISKFISDNFWKIFIVYVLIMLITVFCSKHYKKYVVMKDIINLQTEIIRLQDKKLCDNGLYCDPKKHPHTRNEYPFPFPERADKIPELEWKEENKINNYNFTLEDFLSI